ncbi:hypothetical protein Scani_22890 [Streptomyces caniferus]|uniref:Uncharacterized protein n=1 Tax=Streptomyces caniferus TaxID=285557 RepID=A0A640S6I9_9ACTN|nr:hypothetical protein Scani_22890 [Streptomyces caniferus]
MSGSALGLRVPVPGCSRKSRADTGKMHPRISQRKLDIRAGSPVAAQAYIFCGWARDFLSLVRVGAGSVVRGFFRPDAVLPRVSRASAAEAAVFRRWPRSPIRAYRIPRRPLR